MQEMQSLDLKIKTINEILIKKYKKDKPKKYSHLLGVSEMAQRLANIYNVDKKKALIAALLHDYYKYETLEEMLSVIDDCDKEYCKKNSYLAHAYASANALKYEFDIDDIDIYNAIKHHVIGKRNMDILEKIIFISDYTEANRKFPNCVKTRELLFSYGIDTAIYAATYFSIKENEKRGNKINKIQYELLEEYKEKTKWNY